MTRTLTALPRMLTACALMLLLAVPGFAEIIQVQNPGALPVVDKAGLLTQEQVSQLSVELRTLADTDGTQVVVLTVPTTGDEDIFSFSQRIATDWGIGQKENDNGVLMVVASQDRKVRIHVGYGLEGRLTDALSKRIIEREILPEFRKGNWYGGISKGVTAIIQSVRGEYKAPPAKSQRGGYGWIGTLLMFIFIVFMLSGGRGGRGGCGPLGWILLPALMNMGGHSRHSGWSSGGGWSGGGGGFGGGGFGGGGFGGGGASGGW